ncbi:hypothetical protein TNCV_2295551 [Trichonephila clavipes]|nr:hypothetical protein TNCV_2295551 [Trichonephila clavipes]
MEQSTFLNVDLWSGREKKKREIGMARKRAENRERSLGFPGFVKPVFTKDRARTIDEDSNHLRREKERVAILREKEKSVVCEERAELVYERIRKRMQFINNAASAASTEEMKRLDQCLEDLMKHMGYSEFGSSLRSIENFPGNRYIIKQRQKKNSRPLNKQKLANVL